MYELLRRFSPSRARLVSAAGGRQIRFTSTPAIFLLITCNLFSYFKAKKNRGKTGGKESLCKAENNNNRRENSAPGTTDKSIDARRMWWWRWWIFSHFLKFFNNTSAFFLERIFSSLRFVFVILIKWEREIFIFRSHHHPCKRVNMHRFPFVSCWGLVRWWSYKRSLGCVGVFNHDTHSNSPKNAAGSVMCNKHFSFSSLRFIMRLYFEIINYFITKKKVGKSLWCVY